MKISKLFHWLYATLMLLPIFAILSSVLVHTWNEEVSAESTNATINYKYQTNDVDNVNDLISGNIYHLDMSSMPSFSTGNGVKSLVCFTDLYNVDFVNYSSWSSYNSYLTKGDVLSFYITQTSNNHNFVIYNVTRDSNIVSVLNFDNYLPIQFDFVFYSYRSNTGINYLLPYISRSSFNVVDNVEFNTSYNDSSTNIFYYAVNYINDVPLFNWARNSFLAVPITFITGLFTIPTDSVINTLFSYWLAISVCWLVFDVFMYLPLLAHRWIDKARID